VTDCFRFVRDYEGEIPGVSRKECGNYLEHDLASAKEIAADMAKVLAVWDVAKLNYEE
jgi:S-ribosylhomocysteine lyase